MADAFRYDEPGNHVETRDGLSSLVRQNLIGGTREECIDHPRFRGEAEFWTQIHKGLLSASSTLVKLTADFLHNDDGAETDRLLTGIEHLGHRLIYHAHGHHHIEDNHFFPAFLRLFPQLEHPLDLLDGDHNVLSGVLDEVESGLNRFQHLPVAGDPMAGDRIRRDALQSCAEKLLPGVERLDALLKRHIADEEEICLPALLRL